MYEQRLPLKGRYTSASGPPYLDPEGTYLNIIYALGEWVNPHRERQPIPQGQTSSPPKSFLTSTAKARPNQGLRVNPLTADTGLARGALSAYIYTSLL